MNRKLNQKRFKFIRVYVSCVKEVSEGGLVCGFLGSLATKDSSTFLLSHPQHTGSVFRFPHGEKWLLSVPSYHISFIYSGKDEKQKDKRATEGRFSLQ